MRWSQKTREFTKRRRQRRGQRRLKNELIFYQRISKYSKVIVKTI